MPTTGNKSGIRRVLDPLYHHHRLAIWLIMLLMLTIGIHPWHSSREFFAYFAGYSFISAFLFTSQIYIKAFGTKVADLLEFFPFLWIKKYAAVCSYCLSFGIVMISAEMISFAIANTKGRRHCFDKCIEIDQRIWGDSEHIIIVSRPETPLIASINPILTFYTILILTLFHILRGAEAICGDQSGYENEGQIHSKSAKLCDDYIAEWLAQKLLAGRNRLFYAFSSLYYRTYWYYNK